MDLPSLLQAVGNEDANTRRQAEDALLQAVQQNLPQLMLALCAELVNDQQQETVRQQAGLYMKLLLWAEDEGMRQQKIAAYMAVDPTVKTQIKANVLQTLHSFTSVQAAHVAAMIIGKMAAIEVPQDTWPELLPTLLNNVTGGFSDGVKIVSLQSLGYICDDIEKLQEHQTNQILTCIVDGIKAENPDSVRLAAVTALGNSLYFTESNFEREQERNHIMMAVCTATQSPTLELRVKAYECIADIAKLYYDKLAPYMESLFTITLGPQGTILTDDEKVVLMAIEFWTSVAEEELELLEGSEEDMQKYMQFQYVVKAREHLLGALLQTMTRQDENAEPDDWGMASAASVCLTQVALVAKDEIVDGVMQFVTSHIDNPDWHFREAAVMAFGNVLEGPSADKLSIYVTKGVNVLLNRMVDQQLQVKDTATWALGLVCEHHLRAIPPEAVERLLHNLMQALGDVPSLIRHACTALVNFGFGCESSKDEPTNGLSAHFTPVVGTLLQVMQRQDLDDENTRLSAFEAVNAFISCSAQDKRQERLEVLNVVLNMLEAVNATPILSNDDKENQASMQQLLCGNITVICQRSLGDVRPQADRVMGLVLGLLQSNNNIVHEEALMAAGALAHCMEQDFTRYMEHFYPFLLQHLGNQEDYQVCQVAVGCVGDLSRTLQDKILPWCDHIMDLLLRNLSSPDINRNVKPPVLGVLGDIAMATGPAFEKYLQHTMSILAEAQKVCKVDPNQDEEMVEYINELREGIVEAYTGILNGMSEDKGAPGRPGGGVQLLKPYAQGVAAFINLLGEPDQSPDDTVVKEAVGLIGDMVSLLGSESSHLLRPQSVINLLEAARGQGDAEIVETATWTQQRLVSAGFRLG